MVRKISAALVVMALSGAVSASASECREFFGFNFCSTPHSDGGKDWDKGEKENEGGGGVAKAPEIDPASAIAGLTLLAGGLAVMRGRRVKKSEG